MPADELVKRGTIGSHGVGDAVKIKQKSGNQFKEAYKFVIKVQDIR